MKIVIITLLAAFTLLPVANALAADQSIPMDGANLADTNIAKADVGLKVEFGASTDWPNIQWKAPAGSAWDWSSHGAMVFTLTNPSKQDVPFFVRVDDDITADGVKHCVTGSGIAKAGETQEFYVLLSSHSTADDTGMRFAPPGALGDRGTALTCYGSIDPSHIVAFQIFRAKPSAPATLVLRSIVLGDRRAEADLKQLLDKYGQYTRADWPGKVHIDSDLDAQKQAEASDIHAHPKAPGRDKWGGWVNGPKKDATGFFRTEQVDGKWWIVDPDGRLFLSIGVDVVRSDSSTVVEGREPLFTWLPGKDDPLAAYYGRQDYGFVAGPHFHGKTFNLYGANLARKYGPDIETPFYNMAVSRLASWGFNTLGNWSNEEIGRQNKFPYVASVGAWGNFAKVPSGNDYWGKMPDPFDPQFAQAADASLRSKAEQVKDDPACLGYFFDNELSWGDGDNDAHHYGLSYGALSLGSQSPAKRAFVAYLQNRYIAIEKLNAAWGSSIGSWDELGAPFQAPSPLKTDAQRSDFSAYLGIFAEKYFSVVSSAIKRYDPHHMYLGCRFAWFTPEAVAASAKYVDVISFNIYNWQENKYQFAQSLGKPLIVGEFHFGALDRGMFSGGLGPVKSQQERGASYSEYVKSVLSEPAFVGVHWFQYVDEPTTGRSGDGENYNIGFVSIADTPYPELIGAARRTNSEVYAIHEAKH